MHFLAHHENGYDDEIDDGHETGGVKRAAVGVTGSREERAHTTNPGDDDEGLHTGGED